MDATRGLDPNVALLAPAAAESGQQQVQKTPSCVCVWPWRSLLTPCVLSRSLSAPVLQNLLPRKDVQHAIAGTLSHANHVQYVIRMWPKKPDSTHLSPQSPRTDQR
jgi:hypothetical protein